MCLVGFNPDPPLEIYIIRLGQENTRLNQNFLVRTYQVISLRLKNPASPFIFLAKPNSVKFLMTDLGLILNPVAALDHKIKRDRKNKIQN